MPDNIKSTIYNNKAISYAGMENYAIAEHYLSKSIILKENCRDSNGLAFSYLNLGAIYFDQYKDKQASRYWQKSKHLALAQNNHEILEKVYFNLSLLYESQGRYRRALQYYKQSDSARSRQAGKEKIWELSQVEKKLALQSKQLKINALEKQALQKQVEIKERLAQRNMLIAVALGLMMVIKVVVVFLFLKHRSNRIITSQKQQLETLNNTKDRLFSIIAHDLRAPVNALLAKNKTLYSEAAGMPGSKVQALAHGMLKDTEQTSLLLNNLLHWSFTETGNLFILPRPLLLIACIEQAVEEFSFAAGEKDLVFNIGVPGNVIVNTDQNSLRIILRNLLQNAVKFSYPGSSIIIRVYAEAGDACISIRDHGTGIPAGVRHLLFAMSREKIRKGTRNEQGSGLGLWLVNYLAQKNNLVIFVNPHITIGTEIIIKLNTV